MNKIAEIVVNMVNAVITSGIMNSKLNPISMHRQEKINPNTGTEDLDRCWNNFAPCPLAESPKSIRLVAKAQLFDEDIADVITTKLIMPAAAGSPAIKNSSTKGLFVAEISAQEETEIMQISDRT